MGFKKIVLTALEEKIVMAQEKAEYVRLKVAVNLIELKDAEELPWGVAFAFSSGGRLLAQEVLDEKGTASLIFPGAKEARLVRVVVGPEVGKEETGISDLLGRGAAERILHIEPDDLTPSVEIRSVYMDNKSIEEVKEDWEEKLMTMPGVMGVGIGLTKDRRETCIKIYVNRAASAQVPQIPEQIEGYPVEVEIGGAFRSF